MLFGDCEYCIYYNLQMLVVSIKFINVTKLVLISIVYSYDVNQYYIFLKTRIFIFVIFVLRERLVSFYIFLWRATFYFIILYYKNNLWNQVRQ